MKILFIFLLCNPEKPEFTLSFPDKCSRGLTFFKNYARFLIVKGCDEDMRFRKDSQRGCRLVKGRRTPAETDTTSELQVGNGLPGAPVTVSMSGGHVPQPGWNRGILCIPPLIFSGCGYFLYPPLNQKGGIYHARRKSVHL